MKHTFANPALFFSRSYVLLSIIQALGRRGVKVYTLDGTRKVGAHSRYARFWCCPDPLCDEEGFINFLLEKGPAFESRPVLFPTNDHWATAISKHKERCQKYFIPCVANWDTVELLVHKDMFYTWAIERGYPVPKPYCKDDLLNADSSIFPVIAKPKYRRISSNSKDMAELSRKLEQRRMTVLKNIDELTVYLTVNKDILPYMIFQEYVPGMADSMYTIGIYANKDYEVLGVFTGRKVRGFPPDIGDCVVGQAEKVPEEMITLTKRMVADLHYHGIAEFEFKRSPENNELRLIEINPRIWSWIGITPACGVNLPWMAYADLTGIEAVHYRQSTVDHGEIKYVKLIDDFLNCLYFNKRAGFLKYHMGIGQWWKSLRAEKKVYAEFSWDEPWLGLIILVERAGKLFLALFHRTVGRTIV